MALEYYIRNIFTLCIENVARRSELTIASESWHDISPIYHIFIYIKITAEMTENIVKMRKRTSRKYIASVTISIKFPQLFHKIIYYSFYLLVSHISNVRSHLIYIYIYIYLYVKMCRKERIKFFH